MFLVLYCFVFLTSSRLPFYWRVDSHKKEYLGIRGELGGMILPAGFLFWLVVQCSLSLSLSGFLSARDTRGFVWPICSASLQCGTPSTCLLRNVPAFSGETFQDCTGMRMAILDTRLAFIWNLLTVLWLEMSLYFCLFVCYFVFFWSFCLFCLSLFLIFWGTQLFLFGRVCWKVDWSCSVLSYCKWWCYCCLWSSCSTVAACFLIKK